MALYFRTFSTWLGRDGIWLEDLFVRPPFRRLGLGRALLAEVRRRTRGRVEWAVLDWNEPAHAFYRSLGAAPARRVDDLAVAAASVCGMTDRAEQFAPLPPERLGALVEVRQLGHRRSSRSSSA